MITAFAIVILLLSLLAWLGQLLSATSPQRAARWGLTEPESDVDPTFHADVRAECWWDTLSLWPLTVAAALLLLSEPSWSLFGLAGGGVYLYFAGRGIAQRLTMRRRGIAVGKSSTVKQAYVVLALWGLAGAATIGLAGRELLGRI